MHTLIIVLLGFLVFLLPLGNNSINNSNVMAFEEYEYETNQYENYAMDMANDNYYKSQGSDFIKKIKCNNINSNLNGVEATIGTDNPLGIGAESIQDDTSTNWFGNDLKNSGNFDVDCINNNNNERVTGQVGPQGPPGPQGPVGEPGLSQILPTNIYTAVGNRVLLSGGSSFGISTATCDAGDTVLSGSYSVGFGARNIDTAIEGAHSTQNAWGTLIMNIDNDVEFETVAQCFDNPPLRP